MRVIENYIPIDIAICGFTEFQVNECSRIIQKSLYEAGYTDIHATKDISELGLADWANNEVSKQELRNDTKVKLEIKLMPIGG